MDRAEVDNLVDRAAVLERGIDSLCRDERRVEYAPRRVEIRDRVAALVHEWRLALAAVEASYDT